MFISNGMVYGGKPDVPVRIASVQILDDMMMILTFTTGERRIFDATSLLGPVYEPLRDPAAFRTACLDHGMVTWQDGEIDCAPEYMYDHSFEYSSGEMAISLSEEQIAEIEAAKKMPIVYDEDSPELTPATEKAFLLAARNRNRYKKEVS